MNRLLAAAVGIVLLAGVAYGMGSQPGANTGDRRLDSTLQKLNAEAKADPDGFIRHLSTRYDIPEQEIRQAQDTHGLSAGDIFMASALSKASHQPLLSVAEQYKKNQGKGWGVMAMGMGIKPGSREFQALKGDARGSLDHMRSAAKSKQKHEQEMKKGHDQGMKMESPGKGKSKGKGNPR